MYQIAERGFSVAICDQVEDPKQAKGLVRREITRLITPGPFRTLKDSTQVLFAISQQ